MIEKFKTEDPPANETVRVKLNRRTAKKRRRRTDLEGSCVHRRGSFSRIRVRRVRLADSHLWRGRRKHRRDAGTEQATIIQDGHVKTITFVRFDNPIAITAGEGDRIRHICEPRHATKTLIQGRGVPVRNRDRKRSDGATIVGRIDDRGRVRSRRQVHRISAVRLGPGGKTRRGTAGHLNQGVLNRRARIASGNRSIKRSLRERRSAVNLKAPIFVFQAKPVTGLVS